MIGKFGSKQTLEDAMIYLLVITLAGVALAFVGTMVEEDATEQIKDLEERLVKDTTSVLAKNDYYEDQIVGKIIVKDIGGWLKLLGYVLVGVGIIMMRVSPSKNT